MTILRLTDGTTTADLVWHSASNRRYMLARDDWAPAVAGDRSGALGGVGPTMDVAEEIGLHICGDSAVEVLQNQARLVKLLRQAQDWAEGEPGIAAVVMQYAPEGGTLLESVVLGPAQADQSGVSLAPSFNRDMKALMSQAVRLRFLRRGDLLAPAETAVNSVATDVGAIFTITLASSHPTLSPMRFSWTAQNSARNNATGPLIVASDSAHLGVLEAESLGAGGSYSTVAPAATAVARGSSVLRFTTPATPSSASERAWAYASIPTALKSGPKTVDVFGIVTPAIADDFQAYFLYGGGLNDAGVRSTPITIPRDSPGAYYLGTIDVPEGGLDVLYLGMYGGTTGSTCDIDYLVFAERRSTTFVIFPTVGTRPLADGGNVFGSANTMRGVWDAIQTTYPDPLVAMERITASVRSQMPYQGDGWVGTQGQTVAGIWMACEAGATYRYAATAGGTVPLSVTFTAQRRRAYRVPE